VCVSCFSSLVGLEIVGSFCAMRVARLSRLVVISSCLDESRSRSRVGPCGRFIDAASIVFHLGAIGDACGSWMEELCARFFWCSGDSECF